LDELKDVLWRELNSESNKLQTIQADDRLVHRDKDMTVFAQELEDEDAADDIEYVDDGEIEELEDFEYDDVQDDEA
jgi:GTP-binding protein